MDNNNNEKNNNNNSSENIAEPDNFILDLRIIEKDKRPKYCTHTTICIGSGGFGFVYKTADPNVVVKKIWTTLCHTDISHDNSIQRDKETSAFREIQTLASCQHENVIKLIAVGSSRKHLHIYMELCDMNLSSYHKKHKFANNQFICEVHEEIRHIFQGLKCIHCKNIMHRDIKPENVLVKYEINNKQKKTFKITDFGLAKFINPDKKLMSTNTEGVGTPWYRAPEIDVKHEFHDKFYDFSVDFFAAGAMFFSLYDNQFSTNLAQKTSALYLLLKNMDCTETFKKWDQIGSLWKNCLSHCIDLDPKKRCSVDDVLKFVSEFDIVDIFLLEKNQMNGQKKLSKEEKKNQQILKEIQELEKEEIDGQREIEEAQQKIEKLQQKTEEARKKRQKLSEFLQRNEKKEDEIEDQYKKMNIKEEK